MEHSHANSNTHTNFTETITWVYTVYEICRLGAVLVFCLMKS